MLNKRTVAVALLVLVGIAAYLVIKPFLLAIVAAAIFAILFRPIFNWMQKFIGSPSARAFIICIVALLIVVIPVLLISQALFSEVSGIVRTVTAQPDQSKQIYGHILAGGQVILSFIPGTDPSAINSLTLEVLRTVSGWASVQILAIPHEFILLLISIFLFYYFLRDGDKLVAWIYEGLPLTLRDQRFIDKRLYEMTYAVVYGQIVTAILQGIVAMFGYWLFGLHSPVLWGLLTMLCSLLPVIGTGIVWMPASIYLFFAGLSGTSAGHWWAGVGLFLYGAIIIAIADNLARPLLIGKSAKIPSALALVGVLGGVGAFGFIGIFAGPVILALFVTLYDTFIRKSKK